MDDPEAGAWSPRTPRSVRWVALAVAWSLLACARAFAEKGEPSTATLAAGPEFAASGFHRFWFGTGYRQLWTQPISVPVLDLARFAGGLTPVRQVGQLQTLGLALAGADGRAYTFRSLQKEPERGLPEAWREAWPARIVRDHTSATHPGAALVLPKLAEAAGLLEAQPILVVLPDDAALGPFRATFAGRLGTIEEFPQARPGGPSFGDAAEILTTSELWPRWLLGPENRVDSRAFLRARVLDLFVENYDRHRGQWRWARLPGHELWQTLPQDPDMAFIRNEGMLISTIRGRAPKFVRFGPRFPGRLEGSTYSGAELDRWLLSDLDGEAFEAVVRDVQARLDDEAIAAALRELPAEWQAVGGPELRSALVSRRDKLVPYLMHYYRDLARAVDVHASDRDEVVAIRRSGPDAVEVSVRLADAAEPYYRRRFRRGETREVRVYLHGGRDRVERSGPADGPVRVRVIAGDGAALLDDSASGGTDVWAGAGPLEVKRGRGTQTHAAWDNPRPVADAPWVEPRNYGRWTLPYTQLMYATELDVMLGLGLQRSQWGFRCVPEQRRDDVSVLWSTGEQRGRASYAGTFRSPGSATAVHLDALYSGIERVNYFGPGNETERPDDKAGYRTLESFLSLTPSLRFERWREVQLHLGASLRFSDSPGDRPNVLNALDAYGRGSFAEAGVRAGAGFDSRGLGGRTPGTLFEAATVSGNRRADLRWDAEGFYFPAVLDVRSGFGGVESEAAGTLGRAASRLQLAARVGGRRVWGEYPWFESAFVGGRVSLRGYSRNRFAGDASLYGGVEARGWLFSANVPPVPLRFGLLAFADVGRVWLDGEDSREWHHSWGGGAMLQPLATPFVLTAAVARSPEQTRWYFGYGFFF